MTSDIVEQLRAWAEPISSGYEVPRAAVTLYEAADEIESLRSRLAEVTKLAYIGEHHDPDKTYKFRLDELVLLHRALEARLAAADALLKDARDEINHLSGYAEDETDGKSGLTTWPLLDRIDAHLAREGKL